MHVMMVAYVDPGLGALIWQTVVSALVGLLFYFRKTRKAIVGLFRKMFGRGEKSPAATTVAAGAPPPKATMPPAVLKNILAAAPETPSAHVEVKAEAR